MNIFLQKDYKGKFCKKYKKTVMGKGAGHMEYCSSLEQDR